MTPAGIAESALEQEIRAFVLGIDRALERSSNLGCGLVVLVMAVIFAGLFFGLGFRWWSATLWSLAAFIPTILVNVSFDDRRLARAARDFDVRWPLGSPDGPLAVRILEQLESPQKAPEKIRQALRVVRGEDIVRRRPGLPAEAQIQQALSTLVADPPRPRGWEPPSVPPPAAPPNEPVRIAVKKTEAEAYDYVPLEPLPSEGEDKG